MYVSLQYDIQTCETMICHTIDFVIVMLTFVRPNNHYKEDFHSSDVHKQFLMYRQISDNKEGLSYQPIRIHPVFKDIYFELSATHMVRLSKAVNSAVYKISQLLSGTYYFLYFNFKDVSWSSS